MSAATQLPQQHDTSWYQILIDPFMQHIVVILSTTVTCFILQHVFAALSKVFFPKIYPSLSDAEKVQWNIRFIGILHATIAWGLIPGYIWPEQALIDDPFYGYSESGAFFFSISTGYFLWDVIVCYDWGFAYTVHAWSCFFVFYSSLFPFSHRDARFFLGAFELSTPFLHIRGMQEQAKITGFWSLVNGVIFAINFTVARIIIGTYVSFYWWIDMIGLIQSGRAHSVTVICLYLLSNAVMMGLMYYWFVLIVQTTIATLTGSGEATVDGRPKKKSAAGRVRGDDASAQFSPGGTRRSARLEEKRNSPVPVRRKVA
eukprot:TRINITY_DN4365_c0_g1_i3.p1 TRINITY_DN4365_c0_g1~~TRINITY_DN4365_c0_g1_i3.p1  ORF type:complete len:315 (+),score=74.34 TRINITY_DN4365_c0_g1_i3:79-1023(+)